MATRTFTELTTALEDLIASGPRLPGGERSLVREQELIELLARLRAELPVNAVQTYARRQEIAAIRVRAQQRADEIVQRAQDEVERLVHDPHLQRDARKRADEALREAHERAGSVRASADAFYAATLRGYHERLSDLAVLLERDMLALREGSQALTERTAAVATSGGLPLKPGSTLFAPGPAQVEYREPAPQVQANPDPVSGPNSPAPDSPRQ